MQRNPQMVEAFELFEKWFGWKPNIQLQQDIIVINLKSPKVDLYFEGYESYALQPRNKIKGSDHISYLDIFIIEESNTLRGQITFDIPVKHLPEWKAYVHKYAPKKSIEERKSVEEINMSTPLSSTLTIQTETKIYDFLKEKFSDPEKLNDFVEQAIVEKMYERGGFDNMLAEYIALPKGEVCIPNLELDDVEAFNSVKYERCNILLDHLDAVYLTDILSAHPNKLFCRQDSRVEPYLHLLKALAKCGLELGMQPNEK